MRRSCYAGRGLESGEEANGRWGERGRCFQHADVTLTVVPRGTATYLVCRPPAEHRAAEWRRENTLTAARRQSAHAAPRHAPLAGELDVLVHVGLRDEPVEIVQGDVDYAPRIFLKACRSVGSGLDHPVAVGAEHSEVACNIVGNSHALFE